MVFKTKCLWVVSVVDVLSVKPDGNGGQTKQEEEDVSRPKE